ncbi:MAG: saccharopine dehydrogenase NADP-binding domain-containing protein [Woeseiaceae bacterium]|nr:saccharopine dehydrogenase NADP-binding domain-containing protein [Woeseiaceae bacterium]
MTESREFDVVLWGATGFTGRLVAEYLAATYTDTASLRWAIAGRNEDKLRQLQTELSLGDDVGLITGDSHDAASLEAMAARTSVVITTVGPYALYGSELVAACVESGTHYCDLAGEAQWIRRMIDAHHERAAQTGARIVHCCGFDCVPMDLGVWFLQRESQARYGSFCASIRMLVKALKGGWSGGTMASAINLMREAREDREVMLALVNPYALNPAGEREGPDSREQSDIRYDDDARSWTAPFIMALINKRIVHRSNALLGYPWGRGFRYDEAVMTGDGAGGRLKALSVGAGLGALMFGASRAFTRRLLQRFALPEPGEGPSREQREAGFYVLQQTGKLADGSIIRSRVSGDRDPGYGSTSKIIAECGVCLAKDELDTPGGVYTPASAMAAALLPRLTQNAGLSFEIVD